MTSTQGGWSVHLVWKCELDDREALEESYVASLAQWRGAQLREAKDHVHLAIIREALILDRPTIDERFILTVVMQLRAYQRERLSTVKIS